MAERAPDAVRYTAFLSYSHRDSAAAGRLHRRLESYRMPKRLVGTETARGIVPERLAPIFRDRDELPAATDLSESVRAALSQSGALIILCSPNAAGSLWVAREIETFRALHPDRPVLAAVVEGDPPHCFPAPLRAPDATGTIREPLAADLRPDGDGARLGLLKLVAGITGVGLDDLVQRDATRRIRRVTAVTAAAVVAMLVMAAMTLVALTARREAERQRVASEQQRAAAEGLVDYMLTDLRDRLEGVGRLDIMTAVNERALSYYGGPHALNSLPDESLARRARILHAIGDDNLDRDDLAAALRAFREAHHATTELLARAPNNAARVSEHAKSDFGIGRVHEIRREWSLAQKYYANFAAGADRLIALDPANPDHMMQVASSAIDLGNIQLSGIKDYRAAELSYRKAVWWLERAARARPHDRHILFNQANAHGWLADSFFVRSLWQESLDARLRQYSIVSAIHRADPRSAEAVFRLAAAQRGVAYSYHKLGRRDLARSHLLAAYQAAGRLTGQDADNAEWRAFETLLRGDLTRLGFGLPAG